MVAEFTQAEYRKLRQLAGVAWELELAAHLETLLAEFQSWKEGRMNAYDLSHKIHEFHDGPSRELWGTYRVDGGRKAHMPYLVASAVARGILQRERLGETLSKKLSVEIESLES